MNKALLWLGFWVFLVVFSLWLGKEGVMHTLTDDNARNAFTTGLIGNIIASSLFLPIVFIVLKPKILISPYIIETDQDSRYPSQTIYCFKVINSSIFFKAFDVSLNLWAVTEEVSHSKNDILIEDVELVRPHMFYIESVIFGNPWIDKSAQCACIFTTTENIKPLLEGKNKYLQLQVIVKHGLSGLSGVFTQRFYKVDKCIHKGDFKHGLSLRTDNA